MQHGVRRSVELPPHLIGFISCRRENDPLLFFVRINLRWDKSVGMNSLNCTSKNSDVSRRIAQRRSRVSIPHFPSSRHRLTSGSWEVLSSLLNNHHGLITIWSAFTDEVVFNVVLIHITFRFALQLLWLSWMVTAEMCHAEICKEMAEMLWCTRFIGETIFSSF